MTTAVAPAPPVSRSAVRSSGAGLPALVGLEMRKSLSTRSGKAVGLGAVLLAPAAMALVAPSADAIGSAAAPIGAIGLLPVLIMLAMGVLSTAGEWSHHTVQTTFLLVPRRNRVLAAKAVAMTLLGVAFSAVAAGGTAAVLAVTRGADLAWDGVPTAIVTVAVAGAAFAVIGAGVGAALANTPAALTSLYLVVLGVMPVLHTFKPAIANAIDPVQSVLDLAQAQNRTTAVLILSGWVVVSATAGAVLTRRRPAA